MRNLQQQILNDLEDLPEAMQMETLNFVQFLKSKLDRHQQPNVTNQPNGAAIAKIMERMAARGALSEIEDPKASGKEMYAKTGLYRGGMTKCYCSTVIFSSTLSNLTG